MPVFGFVTNNELAAMLQQVLANQTQGAKAMSAISDAVAALKAKEDATGVAVHDVLAYIQTILQQLKDALANAADAQAAVAAITDLVSEADTHTQQLTGVLPPPPSP